MLSNVHDIYGLDQQTTKLVIDTGASDTVGSPEAVEGLAEAIKLVYPESKVVVNQQEGKRVKFRMADGRVKPALSRVYIGTPLGQLAIYVIEAVGVLILLSIAALRSLKAAICFTTNTMMYRTPGKDGNEIKRTIKLAQTERGHLLFDLADTAQQPKTNSGVDSAIDSTSVNPALRENGPSSRTGFAVTKSNTSRHATKPKENRDRPGASEFDLTEWEDELLRDLAVIL